MQLRTQTAQTGSVNDLFQFASDIGTRLRQQLRSTSDTARKLGYYGLECESRRVLGELEMKENRELGRSEFAKLASEAHEHGMEQIVGKATAFAATSSGTAISNSSR